MVAISRAWYNESYTMAAKTVKSLQMPYTMSDPVLIFSLPLFFVFYFRIRPSELYGPFRSVSKPCGDNFSSLHYHILKKQKQKPKCDQFSEFTFVNFKDLQVDGQTLSINSSTNLYPRTTFYNVVNSSIRKNCACLAERSLHW